MVAEGVERPEQLERLRELDCDRAQGRLIAEPMPAAEVERLMGVGSAPAVRVFDGHNDALSRLLERRPGRAGRVPGRRRRRPPRPAARGARRARRRLLRRVHLQPAGGGVRVGAYFARRSTTRARCAEALAQVALLLRLERESGGRLRVARTRGRARRRRASPRCCTSRAPSRSGRGLDELEVLHAAGHALARPGLEPAERVRDRRPVRVPGLARPGPGADRRAAARSCARAASCGILVDVSHLNARGFWDVAELSAAPLVASHSGAHALCASPRNLTDDQLRAIGERGGLVGINFHVGFLRADGARERRHAARDDRRARARTWPQVAGRRVRRARLGLRRRDDAARRSAT